MASKDENVTAKQNDSSVSMRLTCFGIKKKFSKVPQLSTEELASWLDEGRAVTLLDTRPEEEHKVSKLEGAIRIDPDNLKTGLTDAEKVISTTPTDQPVVLYCSVGYRSSLVADKLLQMSDSNSNVKRPIYNLEGSIFKWANENRTIVDSAGSPTDLVHPYNSFFGRLLDSCKRYNV